MTEQNNVAQEKAVKEMIIDCLGLEDVSVDDIDTDAPLFSESGLGLDSVDALELGLAVQKHFHFQMDSDSQALRDHFYSVKTLAHFISQQQKS